MKKESYKLIVEYCLVLEDYWDYKKEYLTYEGIAEEETNLLNRVYNFIQNLRKIDSTIPANFEKTIKFEYGQFYIMENF